MFLRIQKKNFFLNSNVKGVLCCSLAWNLSGDGKQPGPIGKILPSPGVIPGLCTRWEKLAFFTALALLECPLLYVTLPQ